MELQPGQLVWSNSDRLLTVAIDAFESAEADPMALILVPDNGNVDTNGMIMPLPGVVARSWGELASFDEEDEYDPDLLLISASLQRKDCRDLWKLVLTLNDLVASIQELDAYIESESDRDSSWENDLRAWLLSLLEDIQVDPHMNYRKSSLNQALRFCRDSGWLLGVAEEDDLGAVTRLWAKYRQGKLAEDLDLMLHEAFNQVPAGQKLIKALDRWLERTSLDEE